MMIERADTEMHDGGSRDRGKHHRCDGGRVAGEAASERARKRERGEKEE